LVNYEDRIKPSGISDLPPQEGGEPMITMMGSLIANAVFDATGIRFRELPVSADRILKALG
jgi:nicotinate dehydrogenase subunit B